MKRIRSAFVIGVFLAALSGHVWAQATGSIVGRVTDPAHNYLPDASVTATNEGTNLSQSIKSDKQGEYQLKLLPPGLYTLKAEAPGFQKFSRTHIQLEVDQAITIDVHLVVGSVVQTTTVNGATPQIDTMTGSLKEVVDHQRMVDLPLNGRNAATLTTLVAGAVSAPSNGAFQASTFGNQKVGGQAAAVTISTNGSSQTAVNYQLDGGDNVDQYTNVNQPFPMPDALQEFSVQTSNYSAEYGQNSGAIVNVITRSGTNQFHGDLFEFVRNRVFNATNWFSTSPDNIKRNQFGGTFGGPVIIPRLYNGRNRTFFFFGHQSTVFHYVATSANGYVPTPAEMNGDFSALLDPNSPANPLGKKVVITDPVTKQPFPNNQIPTGSFDQAALAMIKLLPSASQPNGFVQYMKPFASQDFDEELIRIDHTISANDRVTGRYFLDTYSNPGSYVSGNLLTYEDGQPNRSQNLLLQEVHIFSPRIMNDARLTFTRVNGQHVPPGNAPDLSDFGVNIYQPGGVPKAIQGVSVSGLFSVGDHPWGDFARDNYFLNDDVKWELGRHQLSFGGLVEYARFDELNQSNQFGSFNFSGDTTGYALSDFMLGAVRSFSQGSGEDMNARDTFVNLYGEDSIQLTPRFNLSLGLRWEPYEPWNEIKGREEIFRPWDFLAGKVSTMYPNAPAGISFPGDPGFPKGGVKGTMTNLAPRLGFAWDPFGDHQWSIRGGGGMFYNSRVISQMMQNTVDANPFSPSISLTTPQGTFTNPYLGLNQQSTPPFALPAPSNFVFPEPISVYTIDPYHKFLVPVSYQWNLTLEHQLLPDWLVRAAYVGSRGLHIRRDEQLNPVIYNPGASSPYGNPSLPVNSRRTYMSGLASIADETESGDSIYHSLQLSLEKRFSQGFTILANYTWSKSLDDIPPNQALQANGSGAFSEPIYVPTYSRFEYGLSPFDHTHNFVVSYVLQLPQMKREPFYVKDILGGWQWSGIVSVQSGDAFTVYAGTDRSATNGNDRAVVSGDPYGQNACKVKVACKNWLNINAFSLPLAATSTPADMYAAYPYRFGNAGKGEFRGPGLFNWDMGIHKEFPIRESATIQFRAEFFNALNHPNFTDPVSTLSSSGFGSITSAADPRIGQLALKVKF